MEGYVFWRKIYLQTIWKIDKKALGVPCDVLYNKTFKIILKVHPIFEWIWISFPTHRFEKSQWDVPQTLHISKKSQRISCIDSS